MLSGESAPGFHHAEYPVEQLLENARACREKAEYEKAIALYELVLEMVPPTDPCHLTAFVEGALVLGYDGRFEESLASLEEAALIWPRSALVQLNLAKTLLMLGRYVEARSHLEEVVALENVETEAGREARRQLGVLFSSGY